MRMSETFELPENNGKNKLDLNFEFDVYMIGLITNFIHLGCVKK